MRNAGFRDVGAQPSHCTVQPHSRECLQVYKDASQSRIKLLRSCGLQPPAYQPGYVDTTGFGVTTGWTLLEHYRVQSHSSWVHRGPGPKGSDTHAFVHIEKVGSSTLRRYVTKWLNGTDHTHSAQHLRHVAFVRHPLDRFVSAAFEAVDGLNSPPEYLYRKDLDEAGFAPGLTLSKQQRLDVFADHFLAGRLNGSGLPGKIATEHTIPQWRYINRYLDTQLHYVGHVDTMLEELDGMMGTHVIEQGRKNHVRQRTRVNDSRTTVLRPSAVRGVCRAYLADVCCLDISFRTRCEAVGVFCNALQMAGTESFALLPFLAFRSSPPR